MAGLSTLGIPMASACEAAQLRRRRISPRAGRALEVLGHAIDYLRDQYVLQYGPFPASDGDIEAVELLKALNRQVYCECPIVPTLGERLQSLFRRR